MYPFPKTYRIYSFDLARSAVTADFIKASSDEEAVAKAEATAFGTKCELWCEDRLIAQLQGERPRA